MLQSELSTKLSTMDVVDCGQGVGNLWIGRGNSLVLQHGLWDAQKAGRYHGKGGGSKTGLNRVVEY